MKLARRMQSLPPYLFAELDRKKREAESRGMEVIAFTMGDPDLPTPEPIVQAAQRAVTVPANHRYPPYPGTLSFRKTAARWLERRFGVRLDAEKNVLALIGSKEGIAHLSLVMLEPGDVALCPDPGYPVYAISARLAGAEVHYLPLLEKNNFWPDLGAVPPEILKRAKLLWLCYPNNPTAAVADRQQLKEAVAFCRQHDILLCYDAAYSEVVLEGEPSPSILEIDGALNCAVEFHSHSKTYNMTGWRVGFAAGNEKIIKALADLKSNLDSGVFGAVQQAAEYALESWPQFMGGILDAYRRRRDELCAGLKRLGFDARPPRATFYVWMPVPGGDDVAFATKLIEKAGVLVTPGSGFGQAGRGYVRLVLTQGRVKEALERLEKAGIRGQS